MKIYKLAVVLFSLLFAVLCFTTCGKVNNNYANSIIIKDGGMIELPTRSAVQDANNETYNANTDIINVLLLGIDSRESSAEIGDQWRSDSIIIASINKKANTINLVSILRDSKVPISGYEPQKINAAYKYGGARLTVDTINNAFGTDLYHYIAVDFEGLQKIIDLIGGVYVDLTQEESHLVMADEFAGTRLLNGQQAVSYCRIRSIDSDVECVKRQQTVLKAVLKSLSRTDLSQDTDLLFDIWQHIETSYFYDDIASIFKGMINANTKLECYTIPDADFEENLFGGVDDTGSWVWIYDLKTAGTRLKEILK